MNLRQVYLDNNATTPIDERVLEAMMPYLKQHYGNASSVHNWGREAKTAIENAREKIAELINADASEIYFTSGGTESDNMAVLGPAFYLRSKKNHVIVSSVEHHAVLETAHFLEKKEGFKVDYLGVDNIGRVEPNELKENIDDQTAVVSVMHSNNEVGTIQKIKDLATIAEEHGSLFHTDAVCSAGKVKLDVKDLNVDLLSMSGHKIYGPKGIGILYLRKGVKIRPMTYGGHHEKGRRPGTENVAGIVGFARALELSHEVMDEQHNKLVELADMFIAGVEDRISDVCLNGPRDDRRIPSTVNMSFNGIEGESIILSLDMQGVAVASGSACTSGSLDPSHVLSAMGVPVETAQGSIRFSMGRFTSKEDIEYTISILPGIIDRLRAMSPIYNKE